MKKNLLTILGFFAIISSCQTPIKKNISDEFVGQWKFYGPLNSDQKYDGSMDNIICGLEKLPNSDSSFTFHFWFGRDAILTIRDDSTLAGQNINSIIRYRESTGHLFVLHSDEKSGLEFEKLK